MKSDLDVWLNYMDWESLFWIRDHYQQYNSLRRRKLPDLTIEIMRDLENLHACYWASLDSLNRVKNEKSDLARLESWLSKNVIKNICLQSPTGAFKLSDRAMTEFVKEAIKLALKNSFYMPAKRGQPASAHWHTIAINSESVRDLKQRGITNEYLFEFFKSLYESRSQKIKFPSLEAFEKTLKQALKRGGHYYPSK